MSRRIDEIVSDYYTELKQAVSTGKINFNKLHLAKDIVILQPEMRHEGEQAVHAFFQEQFLPFIKRMEIIHQFYDEHSACGIVGLIGKSFPSTVSCAEWFKLKDSKIFEIHHFVDRNQLAKLMK